jgi:hypothetical protein
MLKNLQNNVVLWLKAKTGLSLGFVISLAVAGSAVLVTFVFLCVTGYVWASIQLGPVFGGLAMAGVFLLIAVVGAAASAIARTRTRHHRRVEGHWRCDRRSIRRRRLQCASGRAQHRGDAGTLRTMMTSHVLLSVALRRLQVFGWRNRPALRHAAAERADSF